MLRPLAAGFMKKYPFIKMTYWRADSEELLPKLSAEARANNVGRRPVRGLGRRRDRGRGRPHAAVLLAGARRLSEDVSRSQGPPGADAALLFQHRLQHQAGARRQGAEDLRGPARPAVEGQDGVALCQYRPLSVPDQPAARLGRGQGDGLFQEARRAEDHQLRLRQRAHAGRPRHRRRISDRAQHLRPPPADQRRQGRAGQFAAHGPGAERGRHARRDQGRQASARRHAARRLHPEQGRPGDHGAGGVFPGPSRTSRRRRSSPASCRRRPATRRTTSARSSSRKSSRAPTRSSRSCSGER